MSPFLQYFTTYLVLSFFLGAIWHVVLFAKYYQKLAIYSRIDKPRFEFGIAAMVLQGTVLAYLYPLLNDQWMFGIGLFMILESFMVFAEIGKQNTNSLIGFLSIQTAFCLVQALLISFSFGYIPFF